MPFSWRNLELIPDIILINKDPNLRYFLQDKLTFLFSMHIRETVNAIFQYRFYRKVTNEIKFLSKISELSAAAFNFTLDESYHLKTWYKRNLISKLQEYQAFEKVSGAGIYVHAVGYLQNILGDLHYNDREYDQAIDYYTAAIQPMRYTLSQQQKLPSHQVTIYIRTKLKIGLCLEKIKVYDSAYSIYRTLILNGNKLVGLAQRIKQKTELEEYYGQEVMVWEKPYRRMQLFLRPPIALLDLIEKQRADGVTRSNLERNMQDYCSFLEIPPRFPSSTSSKYSVGVPRARSDRKRIHTLLADYYNNVGGILYYKNKNFRMLHEKAKVDSFGKLFKTKYRGSSFSLYQFTQQIFQKNGNTKLEEGGSHYYPSLSAFIYYEKSLRELLEPYPNNLAEIKASLTESSPTNEKEEKKSKNNKQEIE